MLRHVFILIHAEKRFVSRALHEIVGLVFFKVSHQQRTISQAKMAKCWTLSVRVGEWINNFLAIFPFFSSSLLYWFSFIKLESNERHPQRTKKTNRAWHKVSDRARAAIPPSSASSGLTKQTTPDRATSSRPWPSVADPHHVTPSLTQIWIKVALHRSPSPAKEINSLYNRNMNRISAENRL